MPDNVQITPGQGATIAADEVSGVLVQRVKPVIGADGVAVDVSAAEPMPTTDYLLRRLLKLLESNATVDNLNRQRITVDAFTAGVALPTVTTVTTVATVTGVTNQGQAGGVDLRFQFIENARIAYNTGIRSKLEY